MGTQVALIEPIQVPANPAQMPSLPAWLMQRSAALGSATQPDSKGRYREIPVLPQNLILNSSEKTVVERHIAAMGRFLDLGQAVTVREKTLTNDGAIGVMIAALLIKGGAKLDKAAADALTDDYLDAIEDLPAWCIREAIRRWNRGESVKMDGKGHDFNWRPTPPTLRYLSQIEMAPVKVRIMEMEKLLKAEPLLEFSEERRAEMLEKIKELFTPKNNSELSTKTVDTEKADT